MTDAKRLILIPSYHDRGDDGLDELDQIEKNIGASGPFLLLRPRAAGTTSPRRAFRNAIAEGPPGGGRWATIDLISHNSRTEGFRLGVPALSELGQTYSEETCNITDATSTHEFFFDLLEVIGHETELRFLGCGTALWPISDCAESSDGALLLLVLARKLCCKVFGTQAPIVSADFMAGGEFGPNISKNLVCVEPTAKIPGACCMNPSEAVESFVHRDLNMRPIAVPFVLPAVMVPIVEGGELLSEMEIEAFFRNFDMKTFLPGAGVLARPEYSFAVTSAGPCPNQGRVDVLMGGRIVNLRWDGEPPSMHALREGRALFLVNFLARVFPRRRSRSAARSQR